MPTPSEPGLFEDFIGLRHSLQQERIGDGGREVCSALTDALDSAIIAQGWETGELAVVALGGYGRGELSPHSDIDVMLLHRLEDASERASRLFRPLWDAGLRVGHSVRTISEAGAAVRDRFETQTTLLTARLVAGNHSLFEELMARVASVTRARPLRRHLVAEERQRRRRTPFLVMAPDLKNGRGGLRTLHGLEWERRRESLIGRFTVPVAPEEGPARDTLIRVRNALHAVTGRPHDILSTELREQAARWLGEEHPETTQQVIDAMHAVDRLASRHWPEVLADTDRSERSSLVSRLRGRPAPLGGDRPPGREELMAVLESAATGRDALERLCEAGLLDQLLPEWGDVRSRAQLDPFHEHPVGQHLWRTVDEMHRLFTDGEHYGGVAAEIESQGILLLAAFLHDIGKCGGGDHSQTGAAIARRVCLDLGMPDGAATRMERVVRHHLLLTMTATRRDLDDPAVIDEVAALVGDLETLQMLYLLTVADSRATGATMWTPWKARLVRTLFSRCAARFGGDRPGDVASDAEDFVSRASPELREELTSHLAAMPADYLRDNALADIVWHLELIAEADGRHALGVRRDAPVETVVVVGKVERDTRARVAEIFAANGVGVVEARMATRDDEMMVDTFRVRDDRTGAEVRPERWGAVRQDLVEIGSTDGPRHRLAARTASYRSPPEGIVWPQARAGRDAATGALTVIVKCSDRIGRLAEILGVLAELDLEVRLAKLDSRGVQVVDTFHVERGPSDEVEIAGLGSVIASMIRP